MPKVSCIIPTHGRPEHLKNSLACLLAQTLPPSEILVVDDIDDPRTATLVEMTARRADVPIRRIVNHAHPGASGSRNAGARAATSEIVAFLDDDDQWKPDYLARAVETFATTGAEAVITGLRRYKVDGAIQDMVPPPSQDIAGRLYEKNFGMTGSNLSIRRDAFERVGGFDSSLPVHEDWDLLIRLVRSGIGYSVARETNAEWREHAGARLSTPTLRRAIGIEKFIEKHAADLPPEHKRELEAHALGIRRRNAGSPLSRLALGIKLVRLLGVREALGRRMFPRKAPIASARP